MAKVFVQNRDVQARYQNRPDLADRVDILSVIDWSKLADICFQVSLKDSHALREIVLTFVSNEEIKRLNQDFRNKDKVDIRKEILGRT